jgi:putative phosphoribosyl transferase
VFQNREEAGLHLASKLKQFQDSGDAIVLAIPRGGVIVAKQIADSLQIPLSVSVVKKLGAPNNCELAIGAIAGGSVKFIDWNLVSRLGIEQEYLDEEIKRKKREVEEREKKLSVVSCQLSVKDKKIVILVDDGVATGATVLAAIKYIKEQITCLVGRQAKNKKQGIKIILAVPVIAKDAFDQIKSEISEIVALEIAEDFGAVGQFYREFPQVTDEEVRRLL